MSKDDKLNDNVENKKCKIQNEPTINDQNLNDLSNFQITRVLSDNSQKKLISLEGVFKGIDGKAILVLEKNPFKKETLESLLKSESSINKEFANDIYGKYEYFPTVANGNSKKIYIIFK